jgi:hypothetical protein
MTHSNLSNRATAFDERDWIDIVELSPAKKKQAPSKNFIHSEILSLTLPGITLTLCRNRDTIHLSHPSNRPSQ